VQDFQIEAGPLSSTLIFIVRLYKKCPKNADIRNLSLDIRDIVNLRSEVRE
jgi:hypothetical protein